MTSEQTSTQMTSPNCCRVSANVNHFWRKMKLVHFAMLLLLQSLPYVVHLGDGANNIANDGIYRCDRKVSTAQVVEVSTAKMTNGCALRDTYINFNLFQMNMDFLKGHRHYDGVNIDISEAEFINTNIKLYNKIPEESSPLVFTMKKCVLSGTSGLSLCPDEDDFCKFPRSSRISITYCKFNVSPKQNIFDDLFRGAFTFASVTLLESNFTIANNDITTNAGDNSKIMAVFYLIGQVLVDDKSEFTIQNNKIYMNGGGDMIYLWYANRYYDGAITISGNGSSMVWRRNSVEIDQLKNSFMHMFDGYWNVVNKSKLLLDGNKFTNIAKYNPKEFNQVTQFLWGRERDSPIKVNTDGEMTMRNNHVLSKSSTMVWYNKESIYLMSYLDPPPMRWSVYTGNGDDPIPIYEKSNLRQYMFVGVYKGYKDDAIASD